MPTFPKLRAERVKLQTHRHFFVYGVDLGHLLTQRDLLWRLQDHEDPDYYLNNSPYDQETLAGLENLLNYLIDKCEEVDP